MAYAFLGVVLIASLGFVVAAVRAMLRWRGFPRLLAAAVFAGVVLVFARTALEVSRDATSNTMWPFGLLLWALGGLAALGVLAVWRRRA